MHTDERRAASDARVRQALTATVAEERLAILATLIRITGDWDLAEDCVQDAVEKALARWPVQGAPRNPAAWLTTVARNRALDVLRRRHTERAKLAEVAIMGELERDATAPDGTIVDDRLRLIFTCCHPALPMESRVALTLKTVAGLSTVEIAKAFLTSEPTLSQRLLRAKRKISNAGIPYRVAPAHLLAERTSGVLAVIYLIFNAGYSAPTGELAAEALRLARLLVDLLPDDDEARGLLALIMFQHARRTARFDAAGDPVPMEEQDRSAWDRSLIEEGRWHLRQAASGGRPPGTYRLQAAIAACHATAPDAGSTDWPAIVTYYDALLVAQPSPVIALNRAIAVGFCDGPVAGLLELEALAGARELAAYHLLPAARADFLRRLGRNAEASAAYREARDLAPTDADRRFLHRRLQECLA
jgi:RNA polymerase sigma-70 factor (ECF subfamily)